MSNADELFPDMMDTHQVARYLRVKERKIYDLLKDRRIPSVRVTGKWLFPKTDIDEWLRRNSDAGAVPAASESASARPRPPAVLAGSHDPLLEWAVRQSGCGLALLPGASADGLACFVLGQAAAAGLHVLCGDDYNLGAIQAEEICDNAVLLGWALRRQGLVVAPGNPLGLRNLTDLRDNSARVVMRQAGSGSRLLFEELLRRDNVDLAQLRMAGLPALSETEVGLTILEDSADAGMAVESAARSLRLDFIPLFQEQFDLIVDRRLYFEPPLQSLFAFARSPEFIAKAEALGGYDLSVMGRVRWNAA